MGKEQYKKQANLSFLLFLSELPNFVIVTSLAFTTQSLVIYMDLIDSAGNLLRALFMFILSRKLSKDLNYRYNYGVGKLEAMTSVCLDVVLLLSLLAMSGFAIRNIIFPQEQSATMGFAVIFKVCCVAGDAFMLYKQRQICKKSDSLMFKSEMAMRIKNLVFDATALAAVLLIYIFHESGFAMYFSPVVSILLAVWLTVGILQRIKKASGEILDRTPDEAVQKAVLSALQENSMHYERLNGVDSRVSGGIVFIDLKLSFEDSETYGEIKGVVDEVYAALEKDVPNCKVSLQITNTHIPSDQKEPASVG